MKYCRSCDRTHLVGEPCWFAADAARVSHDPPARVQEIQARLDATTPKPWRLIADALHRLRDLPRYAFDQDGSIYGPVDADAGTFIRHEDLDAVLTTLQGVQEPPLEHSQFMTELERQFLREKGQGLIASDTSWAAYKLQHEARVPHPERTVMPSVDANSTMHLQRPLHQHGEAVLPGASVDAGAQHPAANTALEDDNCPRCEMDVLDCVCPELVEASVPHEPPAELHTASATELLDSVESWLTGFHSSVNGRGWNNQPAIPGDLMEAIAHHLKREARAAQPPAFHRYTITSEGASKGYFRLVEDPNGAWVTWAEVEAQAARPDPPAAVPDPDVQRAGIALAE